LYKRTLDRDKRSANRMFRCLPNWRRVRACHFRESLEDGTRDSVDNLLVSAFHRLRGGLERVPAYRTTLPLRNHVHCADQSVGIHKLYRRWINL